MWSAYQECDGWRYSVLGVKEEEGGGREECFGMVIE